MRRLAILVFLIVPIAARAEDAVRVPTDKINKALGQRGPIARPNLLCDSVVAEDCFKLLGARLDMSVDERCDPPSSDSGQGQGCVQPKR